MIEPERTGFMRRMAVYLTEMFPLSTFVPSALVLGLGVLAFLRLTHGVPTELATVQTAVAIAGLFLAQLILRLMDELKDKDVDERLFGHRPLPSGRVTESDIVTSLVAAIGAFVLLNLLVPAALWSALVLLGFLLLMFRFFFIPDLLRRNLLLNLATHQPVVPLMFLYVTALFAAEQGVDLATLRWPAVAPGILMFWAALFPWEIVRKIRSPQEEDEYVTYSKLLGRPGAIALALASQALSLGLALYFLRSTGASWVFVVLVLATLAWALFGYVRFLRRPTPETSQLKPFAEVFSASVFVSFILEWLLR